MAGVLASTAAAVGILDKAVSITQKLANNSDELDKATLKLELAIRTLAFLAGFGATLTFAIVILSSML